MCLFSLLRFFDVIIDDPFFDVVKKRDSAKASEVPYQRQGWEHLTMLPESTPIPVRYKDFFLILAAACNV